ncbi:MAG: DMT family transporter [Sphingomonas sp.]|jgi:drug/metabolite transporter (DMT)-like permease|uniref:DMT family transporter n=1 Tax=Sphingomonas sp. CD22 TaxID=3100214 RepID=UPI0012069318|nr:DMT family transporter [Sphingomonas sp. CD22]MEA1083506.1 DMT family transporter [Sphingomonas sp. CD22]RZL53191.1 MAG: DMT family transporter [Sphingomonas sp.]
MHQAGPRRKTVAAANWQTPGAAFAALVVANVALAFGPWFVRLADVGPVAAGFWRIALAIPFLAGLALASGGRPARLTAGLWIMLAIGGVAFAADLASWHLGIVRTTMANATLFGNSAILIYPLYGFLVARAWPTRMQGIALLLAAIGAGLLMGRSYQLDSRNLAGDLLCILAGILYTLYIVLMARVRLAMRPLPALALASAATALPMLAFALLLREQVMPQHWSPLVGLALVSQVIGQGCMIFAIGRLSPLVIGIGLLIQPVVAGAIGWVEYGERLQGPDWVGVALVALALVLVRRAEVAPSRRRAQEAAVQEMEA